MKYILTKTANYIYNKGSNATFFLLLFSCVLFQSTNLIAQKSFGKKLEGMQAIRPPDKFDSPDGSFSIDKIPDRERSKTSRNWVVFSDREKNPVYTDKYCKTPTGVELGFMQSFFVAEDEGDVVRIAKAPGNDYTTTMKGNEEVFTPQSQDYGWIRKDKLLLWNNSLIDKDTKYSLKAISVKRLSEKSSIASYIKNHKILDLFNAPTQTQESNLDKELKMFQYLFIYKEENGMYLLGKINELAENTVDDDILGWAPKNQVHYWKDAVCLRINFDADAIAEREKAGFKVSFFPTYEGALAFQNNKPAQPLPFAYDDPSLEDKAHDNPYLLGYPIIDGVTHKGEDIFKTGYITNTVDANGKKIYSVGDGAGMDSLMQQAQKQKENITIMFVLDGNSPAFIGSIAEAVANNANIGNSQRTRNDYELGAIIYYDKSCGEKWFEKISPTTDKDDFLRKLRRFNSAEAIPCPINRDQNGAPIFEAILKACSGFKNNKRSNILVLTGSSTDATKSDRDNCIKEFVNKQVKLLLIQTAHKESELNNGFIEDANFMIRGEADAIDKRVFAKDIAAGKIKKYDYKCSTENCKLVNSAIPATFLYKIRGRKFDSNELKRSIELFMIDIEDQLNKLLEIYNNDNKKVDAHKDMYDEETQKAFYLYCKTLMLDDDDIKNMLEGGNYKLFIEGWTSLKSTKLKSPIFNKSLFLSRREFSRLKQSLEKISPGGSAPEARDKLTDAYKSIIKAYRGGNIEDKAFLKYKVSDMLNMITNLPVSNKLFEIPIESIKDDRKINNQQLKALTSSFNLMYKRIQKIEDTNFSIYEVEDQTFYWVTEDTFHIDD